MARAKPTPVQRTRVDWGAVRAAYIELGPTQRSYARISREYGVSETTVRKWARRDDWPSAAAAADQESAEKAHRAARRSRDQRVTQALRIVDAALDEMETDVGRLARDARISDLPPIVKLAELLEGEATGRVAIDEVRGVILAVVQVAGRFVEAGQRPAFLAALEQATGGLGELGQGGEAE